MTALFLILFFGGLIVLAFPIATTILVSHSLKQIRQLCTKVLWLEKGRQIAFGETQPLCGLYQDYLDKKLTLDRAKALAAQSSI